MKYQIPQKKLFDSIYRLISQEFFDDNLDWQYSEDPEFDESYDSNIIQFYGEKYGSGIEDDFYFQYIKKEYYENLDVIDSGLADKWSDKSPMLELFSTVSFEKWDSLFGDLWRPVFEQWFKNTYPEYPVKTFLYMNLR